MNEFIMLIGVAGCGKSTWAEILKLESKKRIIVSSDKIRGELYGDENDQNHNQKVFQECHRRIRKYLSEGFSVVFDATNLSSHRRESFLKQIKHFNCKKKCLVVVTPLEIIMNRMEHRERKVPKQVIEKQIRGFQCPYYHEGWDEIQIVWDRTCAYENIERYVTLCEETKNDNHHHSTEKVSDHINAAVLNFGVNYTHRKDIDTKALTAAIKYHDIGKPQTKVFHNAKGEPTEEAHYYGHQNYSAYIYLLTHCVYCNNTQLEEILKIANLIQYHMEHFFRTEEKLKEFYDKIGLGEELAIIEDCDMAGH